MTEPYPLNWIPGKGDRFMDTNENKINYSDELDAIEDFEWFLSEVRAIIKDSPEQRNSMKKRKFYRTDDGYAVDIYDTIVTHDSCCKLIGFVVKFEDFLELEKHWEWIIEFQDPSLGATVYELRGHIQKTPEKACELLIEAALVICDMLGFDAPEIELLDFS